MSRYREFKCWKTSTRPSVPLHLEETFTGGAELWYLEFEEAAKKKQMQAIEEIEFSELNRPVYTYIIIYTNSTYS